MGFQVLKVITTQPTIFWDVLLRSQVEGTRHIRDYSVYYTARCLVVITKLYPHSDKLLSKIEGKNNTGLYYATGIIGFSLQQYICICNTYQQ